MMTKIAYREHGSGRPLILLHGYAGSVLHWDAMLPLLSKKYKVIVPNLSHLSMGKENISFSDQIEILAKFIKAHFASETVCLAGISYGAALAWGLTLKYPELNHKIILINPMTPSPIRSFSIPLLKALFYLPFNLHWTYLFLNTSVGKNFLKESAQVFRDLTGEETHRLEALTGRKLKFVAHLLHKFSWILKNENWNIWQEKLDFWIHDSLLIYDKKDPLFKVECYQAFSQVLECEEILVTEGCGHISIQHDPQLLAETIIKFIDKTGQQVA